MTNTKFTSVDSWAFWDVPGENLEQKSPQERQDIFGDNYVPNQFPNDKLKGDLKERLNNAKYIVVGMNPGDAAVNQDNSKLFLNFHGAKKSADYRFAAAIYGTEIWGSFMTDVSSTTESKSSKVKIRKADVINMEKHLDELGVPDTAVLIALGGKVNKALTKYANRPVKTMYHYSRANSYWKADKVHEQVMNILEK